MRPLFVLVLSTLFFASSVKGQSLNSAYNVLFQGLRSSTPQEEVHRVSLEEKLRSEIVSLRKFNLVQRDASYWSVITNELQIKDLLDSKTAVELGNIVGAQYYIDGKFIRFSYFKDFKSSNDGTTIVTYNTSVEVSLNLINLETGKYELAISSLQKGVENSLDIAIEKAFNLVVKDLVKQLSKKFPVSTTISKILSNDVVVFDKGASSGVTNFNTFTSNDNVLLRIIDTKENESTAKLLSGDFKLLTIGKSFIESFDELSNSVRVIKRDGKSVVLDVGENMGLKKGQIFLLKDKKPIETESTLTLYEEKQLGAVYITDVKSNYSSGKIVEGFKNVKVGAQLVQGEQEFIKKVFINAGYKTALSINPIKANSNTETATVVNKNGEYSISTFYNASQKDLKSVDIYSAGLGVQNIIKEVSTSFNIDIYKIGDGVLKNWIVNYNVNYNPSIIEGKIYLLVGAGIGYGRLKQYVGDNVVSLISNGQSDFLKSKALFLSAQTGMHFKVKRFGASVLFSYDHLKYNSWDYELKYEDSTENETAPTEIIPYPKVDLSGLYIKASISYYLKALD